MRKCGPHPGCNFRITFPIWYQFCIGINFLSGQNWTEKKFGDIHDCQNSLQRLLEWEARVMLARVVTSSQKCCHLCVLLWAPIVATHPVSASLWETVFVIKRSRVAYFTLTPVVEKVSELSISKAARAKIRSKRPHLVQWLLKWQWLSFWQVFP
jgi:hypothetical protein